jgi:hypothetical protein
MFQELYSFALAPGSIRFSKRFEKVMNNEKLCKVFLVASFILCFCLPEVILADGPELNKSESEEILKVCNLFHEALKRIDAEGLASLAIPGNNLNVKRKLEDAGSDLFKSLVDPELDKYSCWNDFINIVNVKFRAVRMVRGPGVELLLFDGSKYKGIDLSDDYIEKNDVCDILSFFLVRLGDSWHVSYQYYISEDY